ncbi:adenosylcobinamide-GDP ribazoletransferase [Dehalococcoidia bacterium]|nr:adenosylcobinamide-GDP ribazoletransferase [Dehalococcoidia bacterium]
MTPTPLLVSALLVVSLILLTGALHLDGLMDTCDGFAGKLKEHKPEETVLVVAHGGSLQVLICILLGIGLEHWWQVRLSSASVTIMDISPEGAAFVVLNDTCHLR